MVLVTGGTGLLGSYLIKDLASKGKSIKALYRKDIPAEISHSARWIKGNILDVMLLEELMEGVEQVYHCAGLVSFTPEKESELHKINAEGTANVVNAALNAAVKKMVHVSSVSALGRKRDGMVVKEEVGWDESNNISNYGRSKYFGELEVWRGISEGLNAVIVNPTIILGSGNWNTGSSAIFKNVFNEFPWYTNGISGFVDVKDVTKAMMELMDSDISGERFILNAENKSYKEVFTEIAKCFGKRPPHRLATPFLAGVAWRIERIRNKLSGSEPLLTRETAATARLKVYFDNSKIKKFLPGFEFLPLSKTIEQYCKEYLIQTQGFKV